MNILRKTLVVAGGQQLGGPTFEAVQAAPGIVNVDVSLPSGADGMFVLREPQGSPDVWSLVATTDTISEAEQLKTLKAMAYATDLPSSDVAEYVVPPCAPHTPTPADDSTNVGEDVTLGVIRVSFSSTNTASASVTIDIYLRQVGAGAWTKIADGIARDAVHLQEDLVPEVEYEWYVVAHALGYSVTSATWSFTTKTQ